MAIDLLATEPLCAAHALETFCSGDDILDKWLKRSAMANQASRATRTFVVTDRESQVMGYYALATGVVTHLDASAVAMNNMERSIPVLVLNRLAVDRRARGMKLGAVLLKDSVKRSIAASQDLDVRALLAHALSEQARELCLLYGFWAFPTSPVTLMLRLPSSRTTG